MKVSILMSTYNGAKYIEEQLNSLYSQTIPVSVFVRDDGSNDLTQEILRKYEEQNNLYWYTGENLGAAKSFFDLILNAPDSDFYAFADQDDVWDNDKIEAALSCLRNLPSDRPALYCSRFRPVDAGLKPLAINKADIRLKSTLGRALVEALAPGCTFVFNYKAITEFRKFKPEYIDIHDWALYRIIMALNGNVIYDQTPHISYRQHGNNTIGFQKRNFHFWTLRLRYFFHGTNICARSIFAQHIEEIYSVGMNDSNMEIIRLVADYKKSWGKKIKLIFNQDISRTNRIDTIFIKLLILLGRL